ncbi:MAG: outer membrane protein assembly factor BamA, partial [Spirochaetes bacterium]|nr:outer membrane protein assembly factor BamA [Spirochaetota bacterium]
IIKIKKQYQKKGFYFINVGHQLYQNTKLKKNNQLDLIFKIQEGMKTYIQEINFKGNLHFSNTKLKWMIKTKERGQYGIGSASYIEEKFDKDIEKIKKSYLDRGFINIIIKPQINWIDIEKMGKKKKAISINIELNEGDQYTYGGVEIKGNKLFKNEEIIKLLRLKPGKIFNKSLFKKDVRSIKKIYEESSYPETKIQEEHVIDENNKVISYQLTIKESKTSYIEAVYFEGNIKTKDYILYRVIKTEVGDLFNYKKLNDSIIELENINFFSKVDYEIKEGSATGLITITYLLKEQVTKDMIFGFKIPVDKWPPDITLFGKITERNWLGRELEISGKADFGLYKQFINFRLEDPKFLNSPFSLGASIEFGHRWERCILREVSHEIDEYSDLGISTESELRDYYHQEFIYDDSYNKNYLGANGNFFDMGLHELLFKIGINSKYRFLKYFAINFDYYFIPDYIFLPISRYEKEWEQRVNEIDDSQPHLKDYLYTGWVFKSKLATTFSIETTKRKFYPLEGIRFSITPAYIWGHFDAFTLNTRFTCYLKLLRINFNGWKFRPVLVLNMNASFVFPGFRNLGGALFNKSTAGKGPIIDLTEYLKVDGITIGRGWANSIGATQKGKLSDLLGYARFDASIEFRLPIYEKVIWLASFVDMVNLISGPIELDVHGGYTAWRWWEKSEWCGLDNWYGSIGVGIQLTFPQLPLSFFVVKRFKINYYAGFEWVTNSPSTGNIDFILSITGFYF